MKLLRHLPNALTCCNLLCGCWGVLWVSRMDELNASNYAAFFVWGACAFDFLDGLVARLLKVSSPIGKELDSLADMVSFGVLPSLAMISMMSNSLHSHIPLMLILIAFSLAVFAALRLAKFNIDENQKDSFIGLPTPAMALFITALPFLQPSLTGVIWSPAMLISITILFSYLMISPLELFALKFKNFSWADNQIRFTFIGFSVLLLAWLRAGAIPLIILLYIIMSLVSRVLVSRK